MCSLRFQREKRIGKGCFLFSLPWKWKLFPWFRAIVEMFNMTCIAVHVKRNVYCWTLSSRCEDKREKILMIKTIFEDCQSRVRFVDDVFIHGVRVK